MDNNIDKNKSEQSKINQPSDHPSAKSLTDYEFSYPREQVELGILHIGAGRFHRAHQALYCHQLLTQGDWRWGISAAYILESDQPIIKALNEQQGIYTLIEKDANQETPKVIGSIKEVLDGYHHPQSVIDRISSPTIKIISFTVTEAGYYYEPSTNRLAINHPLIQADCATKDAPKTLFGFLALGLSKRRQLGLAPVTIQSCDNIQGNGDLVRSVFLEFLTARDQVHHDDLAQWVSECISFPNAMVDRITPAADPRENERSQALLGFEDKLAVTSESYLQWVLEDAFSSDHPDWSSVGVTVVENVKPYEKIKIRLLNAGHSAIGYAGFLAGLETIGEIVQNPKFEAYLRLFFQQVESTLPPVEGVNLKDYQNKLIERFTNPAIIDQTLRICKDGSSKIPGFIIPSLQELLSENKPTHTFSFFLASYYVFLSQEINQKGLQALDDTEAEYLGTLIKASSGDIAQFLSEKNFFGQIIEYPEFISECQAQVQRILNEGILAALPT